MITIQGVKVDGRIKENLESNNSNYFQHSLLTSHHHNHPLSVIEHVAILTYDLLRRSVGRWFALHLSGWVDGFCLLGRNSGDFAEDWYRHARVEQGPLLFVQLQGLVVGAWLILLRWNHGFCLRHSLGRRVLFKIVCVDFRGGLPR